MHSMCKHILTNRQEQQGKGEFLKGTLIRMLTTRWRKTEASLSVISIRETIKVRQHIACFHRLGVKAGILVILLALQSLAVSELQ